MSLVTNVIIIVDTPLDDVDIPKGLLGELPFAARRDLEKFSRMDDEQAGGYKALEVDIFACAFNYVIDYDFIIQWFHNLEWREGDDALLIISPQDGGFMLERHMP